MVENQRRKELNIINFPDDNYVPNKALSIYELLLQTEGDYNKVSKILDEKIQETNNLIKNLTQNIDNLSDKYFEEKLEKLKNENRETMMLCEEFQKIANRRDEEKDKQVYSYEDTYSVNEDSNKRLFHKPPRIPKTHKPNMAIQTSASHIIKAQTPQKFSPSYSRQEITNDSCDDEQLSSEDISDSESAILRRERAYKREAAMGRLYRPRSSSSLPPAPYRRRQDNEENRYDMDEFNDDDEEGRHDPDRLIARWRHKVTVPQPFRMTVRDETRTTLNQHRRQRSMTEFEQQRAMREQTEIEETKKQFKANPVPAHVFIPMYASMLEEAQQKRQLVREYNKEILQSMERPFSFYKRERYKKQQQQECGAGDGVDSILNKSAGALRSRHGERQKTVLRARPVPMSSKENVDMEKLKEEALFRKIKAEMRAKKLIEQAKMPGCMEERQREHEARKRAKQIRMLDAKSQWPHTSGGEQSLSSSSMMRHSVPDFTRIHRQWQEDLCATASELQVTQPRPFRLMSEERAHLRQQSSSVASDYREGGNSIAELNNRNSIEWNKSILASLEIAKPFTTKATILREHALKTKKQDEDIKRHRQDLERLAKRQRQTGVVQKLRKSLDLQSMPKNTDKQRQKAKELKIEDEIRRENYRQEIERIREKVYQEPLLFEKKLECHHVNQNNNARLLLGDSHNGSVERKSKFSNYDKNDNFGEHRSYRSTTEASSLCSQSAQGHEGAYQDDFEDERCHSRSGTHEHQHAPIAVMTMEE